MLVAFLTLIWINFVAPSPSLTIWIARSFITSSRASLNLASRLSPILFIGLTFLPTIAFPVAKPKTVSLVDVSLSTLIELKLSLTPKFKSAWKSFGSISASVKIKASIVAIFGAIIPDPFDIPTIEISSSPILIFFPLALGNVSVVMIAFAALLKSFFLPRKEFFKAFFILATGSCSPITPVEQI